MSLDRKEKGLILMSALNLETRSEASPRDTVSFGKVEIRQKEPVKVRSVGSDHQWLLLLHTDTQTHIASSRLGQDVLLI